MQLATRALVSLNIDQAQSIDTEFDKRQSGQKHLFKWDIQTAHKKKPPVQKIENVRQKRKPCGVLFSFVKEYTTTEYYYNATTLIQATHMCIYPEMDRPHSSQMLITRPFFPRSPNTSTPQTHKTKSSENQGPFLSHSEERKSEVFGVAVGRPIWPLSLPFLFAWRR